MLLDLARWFATPKVQLRAAALITLFSVVLTIGVFLRFVPGLGAAAIGKEEPFWVLLLSVLALLFAGYTAIPAALAYREVKSNGERDLDD